MAFGETAGEDINTVVPRMHVGNRENVPGIPGNTIAPVGRSGARHHRRTLGQDAEQEKGSFPWGIIAYVVAAMIGVAYFFVSHGPVGTLPVWAKNPLIASILGLILAVMVGLIPAGLFFVRGSNPGTSGPIGRIVSFVYRWVSGLATLAVVTVLLTWVYFILIGSQIGRNAFEGMTPFGLFASEGAHRGSTTLAILIGILAVNFFGRVMYLCKHGL